MLHKTLKWLIAASVVQLTVLFVLNILLSNQVRAIQQGVRDLLFQPNVPVELVDRVNQMFDPLLNKLLWLWATMLLTLAGYGFLRHIIVKNAN